MHACAAGKFSGLRELIFRDYGTLGPGGKLLGGSLYVMYNLWRLCGGFFVFAQPLSLSIQCHGWVAVIRLSR